MMNTTSTQELINNKNLNSVKAIANQKQIVFIDSQVEDYQVLAEGVFPGIEVVEIDSEKDGIEQITAVLSQKPYSTVHIVSHDVCI